MVTDKNTLKSWFQTGLKPTQSQFWAWMDSFWHKDEMIPITAIENIEAILNEKADAEVIVNLISKNEKQSVEINQTGIISNLLVNDIKSYLRFTGAVTRLYSISFSSLDNYYDGKEYIIENAQSIPIVIHNQDVSEDFDFNFPNNENFILQPNTRILFKVNIVELNEGYFKYVGVINYSGLGNRSDVASFAQLHSTQKKLKFIMYWPRLSPYMDWWKELQAGMFTWEDVADDLDQMKLELGINAVRVFTYYDHQFRQTGTLGWTDGLGNHNPARMAQLQQFIELCRSKGLDVVITMYQQLPALQSSDNWDFLENDFAFFASFHTWFVNGIKDYSNVVCYNLMNEPDGYGVFGDAELGGRVLVFLNKLKKIGKFLAPDLKCIINATTHDNNFRRFPNTPAEACSIYELTDVLAHNSFRWADTGDWAGINYETQMAYLNTKNVMNKPIAMMECGFPANYAQQDVAGYPLVNEIGVAIGGNATVTVNSIVPQGNIFNRPFGRIQGLAHNTINQAKSVGEAISVAEKYDIDAFGAWSAFDHTHPTASYVYRDPFGLINKNGIVNDGGKLFKYAFTEKFPVNLKRKLSLCQGTVGGYGRINGLGTYIDPENNTPNGVFLGAGYSFWDSGKLPISFPVKIQFDFTIRSAYTNDEPLIISIITNGKQLDYRYKKYTVNSWQRIEASLEDIDRGFASNSPVLSIGDHTMEIDFSRTDLNLTLTIDGVLLDYSASGIEPFELWMLADGFKVVIMNNNSDTDIDINEMFAIGNYEGESIPMNRDFAKPTERKLLEPRIL